MSTFFQIPARNDLPYYKFRIQLSGVTYSLSFRFNGRMNRWILDINDASGNQILSGIPLLILRNFLGQYRTLNIPEGIMLVTDETGKGLQPGQYDFGLQNAFWYEDPTQ